MADEALAELLKTQKSLTEWLQDINHKNTESLRQEDNEKRERLKVLHKVIGIPFDEPTQFEATDLSNTTAKLKAYVSKHGQELCALRLIPKEKSLPKLRMRGKTVTEALEWYKEQAIDPTKYRADFIPHAPDSSWATIFIVNQHGIQGEIIYGGHHQLTQGFHDQAPPLVFRYDFKHWSIEPHNDDALAHLQQLAKYLHVADATTRQKLREALGATFAHKFLEGYFETSDSSLGTWFIDYSPVLGAMYAEVELQPQRTVSKASVVSGQTGCKGKVKGPVHIVSPNDIDSTFPDGAILVCAVTTPAYVPLMQKAAAIVTDQGGILSHAAIVARELHKPCIVGTGNATTVLKNAQEVTVDATAGTVC
jgi:phosphohistidine swiveling domain-containing protein